MENKKDEHKIKIIRPQPGFQERMVQSNVDFLVAGAAMGVGKSFAALLMAAEHVSDPNFRMVYLRRNISDVKAGGAGADEAMKIYGNFASMKMSDSPRLTFPSGAFIDFTHMSDQTPDKVLERIRGWAYSLVYIDEGTGFEWSTVKLIFSRNRSAGEWSGKVRITCNPKKSHWLRKWLDWWIDPVTGYPIPERDGIVRYFYIKGEKIEDVVFGATKEEVYAKCRYQIEPIVKKMNEGGHNYSYKNLIKSCTFYSGKLSDNQELLKNNPNYMGSVAAMGERQAAANLLGCWNCDPEDDSEIPIPYSKAESVFNNDPRKNNDKWITADLADTGNDNTIILVWNGLHIIDHLILCTSTPRMNADKLKMMAEKHRIPDSHIIYDGVRAVYVNDYIPEAIPYISYRKTMGKYGRMYYNLKDECYARLVEVIKREMLSFDDKIADSVYSHKNISNPVSVKVEFIEECSVVRFKDLPGGRRTLLNKKEMNQMLGKGRSMDLLDPIAMRMYPLLDYEYGQELIMSSVEDDDDDRDIYGKQSIYDDTTWC